MRLVPTSAVADGAELARDVVVGRPGGAPLLKAGAKISHQYREGLRRAGIHAIYIHDDRTEGIDAPEHPVSEETRTLAVHAVESAYEDAREALEHGRGLSPGTAEMVGEIVERIVADIARSGPTAVAIADLSSADAYTLQHSVDVATLGLLMGERYFDKRGWTDYRGVRQHDQIDERLLLLGSGLLLHDIGKLAVPSEILHTPGRLSPEERKILQGHTRAGVELLKGNMWSPVVKAVVLRHHERWNGSGYPDGKAGLEIHEMARIAAVADVYDAVTSERVYHHAMPAHEGVRLIRDGSGTQFEPATVDVFLDLVAPFPPGVEVRLTDGRHAVVASVNEEAVDRPVVRVIEGPGAPYDLSLAEEPGLGICGWEPTVREAA